MDRREFLKLLPPWLLYRLLPAAAVAALTGCEPDGGDGVVQVEPELELYTPFVSTAVPDLVRFAAIADFGTGEQEEADVAALIKRWGVDFIVTAGDNNYFNGEAKNIDEHIGQFYHEFIYPYKGSYGPGADVNRFFPALGGHDWRQPDAAPHLEYFTLPGNGRYYDVRWGPVHIFILDSIEHEPDGVTSTSTQAEWFRAAVGGSNAPWKIVVIHDPPYSSGQTHGSQPHAQWPFKEWGASAVISGNDHSYERLLVDGFPYFVNGLGGGRIYDFDPDEIVPESMFRFNEDHGAMLIEATPQTLRFQFMTRAQTLIDEYLMEKTAA
jgi:tartrate-resistant acid phosphatase type 5